MSERVALRADASPHIGSGHVMRTLCLADALRRRGAETVILSRSLPARLHLLAEQGGHLVLNLPSSGSDYSGHAADLVDESLDASQCIDALRSNGGAERLVIDNYGLGERFEQALHPHVSWIAVIDDLADRVHHCQVLLDQGPYSDAEARYSHLVPNDCTMLLGPQYSLLREEFQTARNMSTRRDDGRVEEILVFLGGGDTKGMALRAVEAICDLVSEHLHCAVAVTDAETDRATIQQVCDSTPGMTLHINTCRMADLMATADLCVGAGGTATWERCYLGIPTVFANFAGNQEGVAREVSQAGAGVNLGESPDTAVISATVHDLLADPGRMLEMNRAARGLMLGARAGRRHELAARVISGNDRHVLRPVKLADKERLLAWRNSHRVRTASLSDHVIGEDEHREWFLHTLDSDSRLYYVFEVDKEPMGVVHLDRDRPSDDVATWGFYVGEGSAPPGTGTALCRKGLHEAFTVEGLRTVKAEVLATNERSLRLHEQLGFRRAGTRFTAEEDGHREVFVFTLSSKDWQKTTSPSSSREA